MKTATKHVGTAEAVDRTAGQIQAARKALRELVEAAGSVSKALSEFEAALIIGCEAWPQLGKRAQVLLQRSEAIRRLKNQMEAGSFLIEAEKSLEEAWRELP